MGEAKGTSWRDLIKVHPAAEMFPLMVGDEFKSLVEDIRANGLRAPIAIWHGGENEEWLLDGRNRLNAMAELGYQFEIYRSQKSKFELLTIRDASGLPVQQRVDLVPLDDNPYAFVISANIRRRHLTADQKRELIAKLLKAKPERSNLATAKLAHADDKTVAAVRRGLEANSEIPNKTDRVEATGRKARGRKPAGEKSEAKAAEAIEGQTVQPDTRVSASVELDRVGDGAVIQPPAEEEEWFSPAEWSDHEETNQWILSYVDLAKHERRQAHQAFKILAASRFLLFSTAMEGFGAWFRRLTEPEQEQVRKVTAPKVPLKALKAAWEATPPDVRPKFIQWTERREYRRPIPPVIDNQPV